MKTLNLELMGVQEMDAKEVKSTDGGSILGTLAIGLLGAAIYDAINNPDDFFQGMNAALHPFD